jgi:pantetheine-phosphate adenylyltransferase
LTVALFAGRFDPVTNGHLDIAKRAAALFEKVVVGVAASRSTMFSTEEREEMFRQAVEGEANVEVAGYSGLTVDFARSKGATVLIRSMRGSPDFQAEFDQALMNRHMAPEIESVYLISRLRTCTSAARASERLLRSAMMFRSWCPAMWSRRCGAS